jgi:TonB family protein
MRATHSVLFLVVPALLSCAATSGRRASSVPAPKIDKLVVTTSDGSWPLVTLDSARVDSLRNAGVMLQQNVDERPEVVFGPQLHYPDHARQACITGRVIVQAVIGRDGRAEPPSIGVRGRSVDPQLDREALRYMREATFRPGSVHGVSVRTLVDLPIDFNIRGAC